jgi:hypothetical protein
MDREAVFSANKAAMLEVMESVRIARGASSVEVRVHYEGGGDEGGVTDIDIYSHHGKDGITTLNIDEMPRVNMTTQAEVWRDGEWAHEAPQTKATEFDVAATDLAYSALELTGLAGYHNGSGGYGDLILRVSEKPPTVELVHTDYITTETTSEHVL